MLHPCHCRNKWRTIPELICIITLHWNNKISLHCHSLKLLFLYVTEWFLKKKVAQHIHLSETGSAESLLSSLIWFVSFNKSISQDLIYSPIWKVKSCSFNFFAPSVSSQRLWKKQIITRKRLLNAFWFKSNLQLLEKQTLLKTKTKNT